MLYSRRDKIDGLPTAPTRRSGQLADVATVRVRGDDMEVDLTGHADQVPDRPINMPFRGTVDVRVG